MRNSIVFLIMYLVSIGSLATAPSKTPITQVRVSSPPPSTGRNTDFSSRSSSPPPPEKTAKTKVSPVFSFFNSYEAPPIRSMIYNWFSFWG